MARVFFPTSLRKYTRGVEETSVDAGNVRDLIRALDALYPGIAEPIRAGMAVAIDGEIIQEAFLEELGPQSEIHFVPSISGG